MLRWNLNSASVAYRTYPGKPPSFLVGVGEVLGLSMLVWADVRLASHGWFCRSVATGCKGIFVVDRWKGFRTL
ncbi:hypothetical protein CBM2587_U10001 [Cupriavidus taiwanensis]|uniref:Uncharacterized protein n=1 Tax=Cupriavidus taiwanensis TaxID=164546 RepID=A0A375CKI1_9BURK|nr:hypothetical protein CBM2587_U10001 [Cupriavidus taiwanensis]